MEDSEEDELDDDGAPPRDGDGSRAPTYDVDGIHEKLEDIGWTQEVAWEETQAITSAAACEVADVDDDLERELAFYNQVRVLCVWRRAGATRCLCCRACSGETRKNAAAAADAHAAGTHTQKNHAH